MADAEQATPKFRHISDIEVWLTPDRNYFMFILLSVFCGFFALDHIYLRSFDTAFQKILYNFFGLGIWYWWDVCQIFTEGKRVQTEGLTSPFDWTQGIGRGVFAPPGTENKYVPQKSYIIWAFLAMFGGFIALDKFYLGDYMHAISKIVSIYSPAFLFGLIWVAWDAIHAFFMTKDVISGKISLPFPLTWIGYSETDGSIFLPSAEKSGAGAISAIAQVVSGLPMKLPNLLALAGLSPLKDALGGLTSTVNKMKDKAQIPANPMAAAAAAIPSPTASLTSPITTAVPEASKE